MSQPTDEDKKPSVTNEWVVNSDMDTVRAALNGTMAKRGLNGTALTARMGSISTSMFAPFLRGTQKHLRLDSFLRAMEAQGFEVVVREPQTSKTQRRLELLKAERLRDKAKIATEVADRLNEAATLVEEHAPGEPEVDLTGVEGPLRDTVFDPALRAEVGKILADNGLRMKPAK